MPHDVNGEGDRESSVALQDILEEGQRLVEIARASNVTLRLLGGVGIALRCPSEGTGPLQRPYGDLDFATPRRTVRQLRTLLESGGYAAERLFNAMHGDQRLIYHDDLHQRHLDIFVGTFRMCHELDLEPRLDLHPLTLSLADLLLTKLQIVKLNVKDANDALALLVDHAVTTASSPDSNTAAAELDGKIDAAYVAGICARDWGWYTTVTDNLRKISSIGGGPLAAPARDRADQQIAALLTAIESAPKTLKWRTRAALGRRIPWYEDPEEVQH
jgi:hypothetical protein